MALTDTFLRAVKSVETDKKYSDGGGLFLFVPGVSSKQKSRGWRLAYRFAGKQKTLALGVYPDVSLADARDRRQEAKRMLASGVDPSQDKKEKRIAEKTAHANTFSVVADELLVKKAKEGHAETTLSKTRWLFDLARPALGNRPIAEIKAAEILAVLREVEARGNHETARRLRSTISQVFQFAGATTRAEHDPTTTLRGALTAPVVTHRAALTNRKEYSGLLRAVWGYDGRVASVRTALMLLAYLYPRPGEIRFAEWQEFDLEKATWTIPAKRAKMRRSHVKPLPRQVVEILTPLQKPNGLVVPGTVRGRALSENTLNATLRRLGFDREEVTSHGFRASASTMLNDSGLWSVDAIEAELGHIDGNKVRSAYNRGAYWDERVRMAQWWADEIDKMRKSLL